MKEFKRGLKFVDWKAFPGPAIPPLTIQGCFPESCGPGPCKGDACLWFRAGLLGSPESVCLLLLLFFP